MNSLLVVGRKLSLALPMRRRVVLPLLSACLLALGAPGARGQVTNVDDTTSTPIEGAGHNYVNLLSETVNPANGSVSIKINLPVPPGRGLTPMVALEYDSNS